MKNQRGITLVELMIVVAIVAILAGLASIAYGRYISSAKVEKLRQYASEVASGQERFRSRNNVYWNPPTAPGEYRDNTTAYNNLLDFNKTLPEDTEVFTQGWPGDGTACAICEGAPFDADRAGFAVVVKKDMKDGGEKTTVILTNTTEHPILLWEGE